MSFSSSVKKNRAHFRTHTLEQEVTVQPSISFARRPSAPVLMRRRVSDHAVPSSGIPALHRRVSSMDDFQKLRGKSLRPLTAKSKPADCALTICSVRPFETPRLNTVYEHPAPHHSYRGDDDDDEVSIRTTQTTTSRNGTVQMI